MLKKLAMRILYFIYVSSQEITVQQLMAHISAVKKDMVILEKSEFTMIRNDTEVSLDQALSYKTFFMLNSSEHEISTAHKA